MPDFKILYAFWKRKLFLPLILAGMLLAGCGKSEERFLFERQPEVPAATEDGAPAQAAGEQKSVSDGGVSEKSADGKDGVSAQSAAQKDASLPTVEPAKGAQEGASAAGVQGTEEGSAASEEEKLPGCVVHICGAVRRPGVYELPQGSRLVDAVEAGGGFAPEADQDACNLAALVTDGCQIYIMTQEESAAEGKRALTAGIQEEVSGSGALTKASESGISAAASGSGASEAVPGSGASAALEGGRVNLNTADANLLKTLPGIGDSRAAAIIAFREEHGQFQRIEDVMKVSGIKQAAFDRMKDKITV